MLTERVYIEQFIVQPDKTIRGRKITEGQRDAEPYYLNFAHQAWA